MKFFTYILLFESSFLYTGSTANLDRRKRTHFKRYGRCKIIWRQIFPTRDQALAREKQIKGWNRDKKLALAANDIAYLSFRSKRSQYQRLSKT